MRCWRSLPASPSSPKPELKMIAALQPLRPQSMIASSIRAAGNTLTQAASVPASGYATTLTIRR